MADKRTDSLVALIAASNVVKDVYVREALKHATKMSVPLERALVMCGYASDGVLSLVLEAQGMVDRGQISEKVAVSAVRLCSEQNGYTLQEAIATCKNIHVEKVPKPVHNGELAILMFDAGLINKDQLRAVGLQSQETNTMEGCLLRLNRQISNTSLSAAINAQLLIQNKLITREQAVEALKYAHRKTTSIEQALFEHQMYKPPPAKDFKLSDLIIMAGLITEGDRMECLEARIVERKPLGDILVEKGLMSKQLVYAALQLLEQVAKGQLRAYQVADALRRIKLEDSLVGGVIVDLLKLPPPPEPLNIADLLTKGAICKAEAVSKITITEPENSVLTGKLLLNAGLITEPALFVALRCQSLLKNGYLSEEHTINVLRQAIKDGGTLDQTLYKMGVYVPASMQFSWM